MAPITAAEYERIPDPPGGRYELHHGELVFESYPVRRRPLPENEVWGADVACVRGERDCGTIQGWPDRRNG